MSDIVERLRRGHHNADLITVGGVTHDGRCLVAADEITRLRSDLAAAQEREQRMRGALILAERIKYMEGKDDGWIAATMGGCITAALSETSLEPYQRLFPRARAALSAMRGKP